MGAGTGSVYRTLAVSFFTEIGLHRVLFLLASLSAIGWIGGIMYTPAIPQLARDLGTNPAAAQFTLTVFLAVFAVSQLIYGPLSDRYGRRWVLLGSLLLYGVGSVAVALSPTIEWMTLARVLQAFGAVGGTILARAIARDIWGFPYVRRPMALINSGGSLAPLLALVTGGFVANALGWQGIFWVTAAIAFFFLAVTVVFLPETHKVRDASAYGGMRMLTNYGRLLRSPLFLSYAVSQALLSGGIFGFMTGGPFVVIETLGVSSSTYGILTAMLPAGFILGNLLSSRVSGRVSVHPLVVIGCTLAAVSACVSFAFVWAGTLNLAIIYPLMMVYTVGVGINIPNSMAGALEVDPKIAGSGAALLGFTSFSAMSLSSFLVGSVESGSGLGMTGMLATLSVPGLFLAIASVFLSRRVGL